MYSVGEKTGGGEVINAKIFRIETVDGRKISVVVKR